MLPAVHAAQVVLSLFCLRLVIHKLRQVPPSGGGSARSASSLLTAVESGDAQALGAALGADQGEAFQLELVEAAVDALSGGGDVGAFVHTAALDAGHRAIAGARVIRGMATLASALGLLGAMVHHYAFIYGDYGPSAAAWAAAEESATRGALLSMGLGLGTAVAVLLASRVIRARVVARLAEIKDFAQRLEAAAARSEQWTGPVEE